MKRLCKVKPSKYVCATCIDMQESCNQVKLCSDCDFNDRTYEIIEFGHGLFTGTYALVLYDGKIKKVSIDRIYDIVEADE